MLERNIHLLPLSDALDTRMELVQCAKIPPNTSPENPTFPVLVDRWRQLRTKMQQLTRGMKRCRRRNFKGEASTDAPTCRASILHKDFWLEALDEQHRYGFHLRAFHKVWKHEMTNSRSSTADCSFFHWLDHGNGRKLELPECNQLQLRSTLVEYCTVQERRQFELQFVSDGENVTVKYAASGLVVNTDERSKWIFVVDLNGHMYLNRKCKGRFHHSSFVAGAPIFAAGKIIIKQGTIVAIEPHSGHFKPRLDNLQALCSILTTQGVDIGPIAFIKPKKWTCAWPFPPQPDLELEDFAGASDTEYGGDRSDSEEMEMLLPTEIQGEPTDE
ncbi:hypothetical protein PHYBOEH_004271 [Phytophthora boehmeriae]|uniref:Uncharacterized protein n=1 Tax=Phytophthora boehmeriae TaxID=109152 RepID=A0A8T1WR99_9STRA|nr:hypothetical protein PHYBOEH_004271 [Phytophthora boehmeriae]